MTGVFPGGSNSSRVRNSGAQLHGENRKKELFTFYETWGEEGVERFCLGTFKKI